MPDSAATPNVFLDTEVFDSHQLDFTSPNLRRLVRLAVAGNVHLLLTTVTVAEVKAHLDKHAKEAFKQVKNYRRISPIVKKMLPPEAQEAFASADEETFRTKLHGEFDRFLSDANAVVLSVDRVSPEMIFKDYFALNAPFAEGAKKSEFPDAFASAALQAWCKGNDNATLYVVSDDKDWKRMCHGNAAFLQVSELSGLLEKFADSVLVTAIKEGLDGKREQLKKILDEKIPELEFYTSDTWLPGAEVNDVEKAEISLDDFHVVEAKDGSATAIVHCTLDYQVSVTANDPDSAIYDHETKDVLYIHHLSGSVCREDYITATVSLTYDSKHPENITIQEAEFEDCVVDVDVEQGELALDDDEGYYDNPETEPPAVAGPDESPGS